MSLSGRPIVREFLRVGLILGTMQESSSDTPFTLDDHSPIRQNALDEAGVSNLATGAINNDITRLGRLNRIVSVVFQYPGDAISIQQESPARENPAMTIRSNVMIFALDGNRKIADHAVHQPANDVNVVIAIWFPTE